MAFLGVMPLPAIFCAAGFSWLIVMGTEIVILPLTKKLADRFKLLEGVEHYDEQPAELPASATVT